MCPHLWKVENLLDLEEVPSSSMNFQFAIAPQQGSMLMNPYL